MDLSKFCSSCGNESPAQFLYCGYCGAPLPPAPIDAESTPGRQPNDDRTSRRLVTVLFADLTNYTSTSSRVDPEIVYYTVRELFERLARSVRRQGGYIDRYVGDGFLAAFGLPEAHENDPARALQAALDMQQSVADLRAKAAQNLDWELELRIGVNTGPVIRGQIDTGSLLDASVFGHAVNLANRLQEAARPGTILVSEAVNRRTRAQFDFAEPVRLQLRGIDRAVIGYELIGQRLDPHPSRGLVGRKTELVGRQIEFETLISGVQRLKVDRRGMITLVSGPAGIGKTRLVDDVLSQLTGDFKLIRTGCSPTEITSYGLLTKILEDLAGITPDDTGSVRKTRINDYVYSLGNIAREVGPAIHELVGSPGDSPTASDDPQQEQRRILTAIRKLFAWLATRQALILVLDDLQWADPSSLHVLVHVSDLVNEVPLTIVAIARSSAYRTLQSTLARPDLTRSEGFYNIRLLPLSLEESELLVSLLLQRVSLPMALRRSLVDRGGGNPLLIEELVRMLLDKGVIHRTASGWEIEEKWENVVQQVPDTVNGLILGRYDRLSAKLKQVLIQASVLGPSFSLPLLVAMADFSENKLKNHLKKLEDADFLRRSTAGRVPVYFFRHALMQEAIYETLVQSERRSLHLRAAQVVQQLADDLDIDSASLIGHHLEKANSPQAFSYLMKAAAQAAARYANEEAIANYQRAFAALPEDQGGSKEAIDVALGLAEMLVRINQLEQARETLEEIQDLASQHQPSPYRLGDILFQLGRTRGLQGDHSGALTDLELAARMVEARTIKSKAHSLSNVELEIGWVMCRQGKLAEAQNHAERALALAVEETDLMAVATAHNLLTPVHYWAGRLSEAVECAQEALRIREQIGDIWGSASTQTNLAGLYHRLGKWEKAESLLRQSIFVRQEIGDYQGVVLSANVLGLVLLESGRLDEAMDWLQQALAIVRKREVSPDVASQLYGNLGLLWLRMGEPRLALGDLDRCHDLAEQTGNMDLETLARIYLAEARLAGGEREQARSLIKQISTTGSEHASPEICAELSRVRSLLFTADGRWSEAIEENRQARELYHQLGNRYEVAHLQIEAAEIQLSWHQMEPELIFEHEVRTQVLDALKVFQELPAFALIPHAEDVLTRISERLETKQVEYAINQRAVVIVYLGYRLPVPGERSDIQSLILDRLQGEMVRLGQSMGAAVSSSPSAIAMIFSDREPGTPERLAHNAVKTGKKALDIAIRLNRSSRRQYDVEIPLTIGISGGRWRGEVHNPSQVSQFLSSSNLGRQVSALSSMKAENAMLITHEIAESVWDTYEMTPVKQERLQGQVFKVGRTRAEVGVPQALPRSSRRLIGRDNEMSILKRWIEKIQNEPQGFVCYLEAQAGMGKTRLVEEIVTHAQSKVVCLLGKCEAFRSNISYWPIIDILEQGNFPETEKSRRLKTLLALRPPDDADEALLNSAGPEDLQRELFGRLRSLMLDLAHNGPLLVVIEDIHCIDLSSLDLIDMLLPLTMQMPISLMLVARAEMPGPHRAMISRAERVCRDRYFRIHFPALTEAESINLVEDLLQTTEIPDRLCSLIRPFAGHPLSLEEALRFLVERGLLWRSNGRWQIMETEDRPSGALPTAFTDLVLGRLDALDKDTLHVFQAAAVLGEYFDRTVLARIVPQPALSRRLAELAERGWLISPPTDRPHLYRFKHTLTRETVYATMLTSKRQLLHQRAGEAIRGLYPEAEEEHVELLAHHFGHSSLREEALHYLVRAAEKSAGRYAHAESLNYYTKAMALIEGNADLQTRHHSRISFGLADVHLLRGEPIKAVERVLPLLGGAVETLPEEIEAAGLRRLAEAQRDLGELDSALETFNKAFALLDQIKPAEITVDNEKSTIQLGIAQTLFDIQDNKGAKQQIERLLETIVQKEHTRLAAHAFTLLGGIAYRQNDFQNSSKMVQKSLSMNQLVGNRNGAAADYANLGVLAAAKRDFDDAEHYFSLGLAIYEELGNSRGIAIARNNLGQMEMSRGAAEKAIEHLGIGAQTARQSELTQVLAQTLANLGHATATAGRSGDSLSILDEAESICERYGFRNLHSEILWKRADTLSDKGEYITAEKVALAARAIADELGSTDLANEAQRALAKALRHQGRATAALGHAAAAWQSESQKSNSANRAKFAAEYALALLEQQRFDEAQRLFQREIAPATLTESPPFLDEINQALARVRIENE